MRMIEAEKSEKGSGGDWSVFLGEERNMHTQGDAICTDAIWHCRVLRSNPVSPQQALTHLL
jgi:hypothetical protein